MSAEGPLSDEDLERLAQSPIAQLALACRDVTDAVDRIRENEILWTQMVEETEQRASTIRSEDTAEDVALAFLEAVEHYGGLARPEADDEGDDEVDA